MYRSTLELDCHVRPGANAVIFVSVGQTNYEFDLTPTINWVSSSSRVAAHKISMDIEIATPVSNTNTHDVDLKIKALGNDVLVCGYSMSRDLFQIASQPVWDEPGWQPYDISGHQGENAQYQGNGSLQILNGQTVEFGGTIGVTTAS
jgi:hypothetical protein